MVFLYFIQYKQRVSNNDLYQNIKFCSSITMAQTGTSTPNITTVHVKINAK
jgi:hypothetical protein